MIAKKVQEITAMEVDIHTGPAQGRKSGYWIGHEGDKLHLYGLAHHRLKSICIARILEEEAAYMMESVISFIDATDDLNAFKNS